MFTIISHDLKNPFSGILGLSDILIDDEERKIINQSELKYMFGAINKSTKSALHLLSNLFDWSQTDSDKITKKINKRHLKKRQMSICLMELLGICKIIQLNSQTKIAPFNLPQRKKIKSIKLVFTIKELG